ncbi:MAG: FeoB small GTPase domain-containing protein [Candidatus Melainabacteria bacterium]
MSSESKKSKNHKILLIGNPNVGKSAVFQALSGEYVEVSNYPGTTVELSQASFSDNQVLIDTPGVYGISAFNDEERITKEAVQKLEPEDIVLNVISAITLKRDLFLTLHLIDLKIPFILVINQIDEARKKKIELKVEKLEKILGLEVFTVSALTGEGITELKERLQKDIQPKLGNSSPELAAQISKIQLSKMHLLESDSISKRDEKDLSQEIALNSFDKLMLLEEDSQTLEKYSRKRYSYPSNYPNGLWNKQKIYTKRRERVDRLIDGIVQEVHQESPLHNQLNAFLIHPFWGTCFAICVSFFFLYQVLGVWVAGDLVNLIEKEGFEKYWNPNIQKLVAQVVPVEMQVLKDGEAHSYVFERGLIANQNNKQKDINELTKNMGKDSSIKYVFSPADLIDKPGERTELKQTIWSSIGTILAGKYGLLTLTITYLLGVLLPLVWFFYLSWALFEDSGYLPRLSVLADGFFRKIGLNGRGIIPLVLGLGCVTMAMVTTRLMTNKREQLIMMILLAIAVPCSAQLALIQGLLVKMGGLNGWLIWVGVILSVLCLCGFLANKLLPGIPTPLIMDLPPLRIPRLNNLILKANQKSWFFLKESGIAFFWASAAITIFQVTGILHLIIEGLKPLISGILHLPKEVALSFLLGMVRRDFGAFGLLDLPLNNIQIVTACVTLTLFVPCIATLGVMIRERNAKTAFGIWFLSWFIGFGVGGLLTRVLEFVGFN